MIRWLMASVLRILIRLLDDSVPVARLQAYLQRHKSEIQKLPTPREFTQDEIYAWIGSVRKDRKLIWQGMGSYQREMILFLDDKGTKAQKEKIIEIMELLLRHVEVRRKRCFFRKDTSRKNMDRIWEQRHETSILFCEFAARHNDLRYLNAAFKMNDWAFYHYRCKGKSRIKDLFLFALETQEKTVRGFSL